MSATVAKYRKFAVAAAGAIASIVSLNVVSGTAQTWLVAVLTAATALGVYTVPNTAPQHVSAPPVA